MIGKTGVFILLISFLHLVSSFPTSLGDNFKCKSRNGKFPKPGSFCRSYYVCANWSAKEKDCPQDQNFFPAKGYCVSADDYPCLEKPHSKECPLPDGKFLKPGTNCKTYYDCCKGRPTEKKCTKGTLFDHVRGKCDWPEYVTCPDKPKSKKCPRLYGKFLKPGTRCKQFYECHDGVPMKRKCPSGELFDPDRELCEWEKIYTCVEDVSTTKSTSHSTSTLISTSKKGTVTTSSITPKIFTDSDEDSSSSEENSSEENTHSSTRSETISTSVPSSTFSVEYTESTEGEVLISSTQSPPIVETSSTAVSNTEDLDDVSTVSKTSTASFTDEYVTKTATYPEKVTEETHPEVTYSEVVTKETPSEVTYTEFVTKETPSEVTHTEVVTKETPSEVTYTEFVTKETASEVTHTEVVTKETPPEVTYTEFVTKETPSEVTHTEFVTKETPSEVTHTEFVTKETPSEVTYTKFVTQETPSEVTFSEFVTKETPSEVTHTEDVTKETQPEVITDETHTATYTIDDRNDFSTTFTPGLTDSVTTHIFCPKPNGYFPHPYDKHKFIACSRGIPTVMNCPENLVYDHKRKSCEYNIKKRKMN